MKLIPSKKQLKSPLVWMEINLKKITKNILSIKKITKDTPIMAVLKANAYGIGAQRVAPCLEQYVDMFGVVGIFEAKKLREANIKKPILNLGIYNPDEADNYIKNNITPSIFRKVDLQNYYRKAKNQDCVLDIWIKVDTGLGRLGIPYQEAYGFIKECFLIKKIRISGIYSTLTEDTNFDRKQLKIFKDLKNLCEKNNINIPIWSIASSGAVFTGRKYFMDMVRIGMPILGFYPSKKAQATAKVNLKPAVEYKTRVACIKEIDKNESIFYRRKFIAKTKTKIAILLPGYSYGLDSKLINDGQVLIRGRKYPFVGGISATNCFVNIGTKNKIDIGDEVVIFGKQKDAEIKLDELCKTLNQNEYEILSCIPEKVTRIYKQS